MEIQPQSPILHRQSNGSHRRHSLVNVLRMGHCAPAVMQTLTDIAASGQDWLVRLSAGMPGGIGNTGAECGGITSPLAMLGLRYGLSEMEDGLPVIFDQGHALCRDFLQCHHSLQCRQIRSGDGFPRQCFGPILRAPGRYLDAAGMDGTTGRAGTAGAAGTPIPAETRAAYSRLYAHLAQNGFHCAQAVFDRLGYTLPEYQVLYEAVSAFLGGTLFMGMTCSAFTAGVMAVGLRGGEIENNPWRVLRMIATMALGGNAFDESLNKFNRSMNRGYRMAKWFRQAFGSTQCQAITRCDFSTPAGVSQYIQSGCITRCQNIAAQVAAWVPEILA